MGSPGRGQSHFMMPESGSESLSPCSLGGVHARHQSTAEPVQQTRRLRRPSSSSSSISTTLLYPITSVFFTRALLLFVRLF